MHRLLPGHVGDAPGIRPGGRGSRDRFASPFLATSDSAWIVTGRGLLIVLLLAGISSALALVLFSKGLLVIGVAKSYTFALTEPLTAWLLSTFVLGQKLAPLGLAGVAILLLASEMKGKA